MTSSLLPATLRRAHVAYLCCLALAALLVLPTPARPCGPIVLSNPTLAPAPVSVPGNRAHEDGYGVDLSSGIKIIRQTDLVLPDILPVTVTRTYRPSDAASRAFGIGTTHAYDLRLVGDGTACTYADLILPDGSRLRYNRIAGTGCNDAVLEHTTTPTRFFRSILHPIDLAGSALKLADGTSYVFGDSALLSAIEDPNGNHLTVTRQGQRVSQLTTPNGRTITFTYDASNRITQAKDSIGRVVTYTYDASGRLWKVTDANGGVTEHTYDGSHRLLTIKNARGIVEVTIQYDANGRVYSQTLADNLTYQFAYTTDASGKITQTDVTDPRGTVRRVTFNAAGYTVGDVRAVGTPEQQTTVFARQAGTNLILSVTDSLNRQTAYVYDAIGDVTSLTRLAGTAAAVTTTFTYTPFTLGSYGLLFAPPIRLTSITDPLGPGHTISFTYDSKGNVIRITNPLGKETQIVNNEHGQPLTITDPLGPGHTTTFTYDVGDLVAVTDPEGNTTTRFVDSAGRVLSLTTPQGQTTRYEYDVLDRLTKMTDPLNGLTQFSYDPNHNLLSVTDARTKTTSYQYDNRDRVMTRTDPLGRSEHYQYDGMNNLTQVTDRKTQPTVYQYDGLNRRTLTTYADSSTTAYTYDGGDRLTQATDSINGALTCGYDGLDRLTSEGTPRGTVGYKHDAAGRRTALNATGQSPASYSYDNTDRLTSMSLYGLVAQYGYDDANRRTALTLPNGVKVEYAYDKASRLTSLTYKLGTTALGDLTYQYDRNGQRTKVGGTFARTNLPDPVSSATYDAANRPLTFDGFPVSHDNNGNLLSLDGDTFTWNVRDQLVGIVGAGLSASFQYDGVGRRSKKTINGQSTEYLSDGINPLQEQAVAGGPWTGLTMTGPGLDEIIARGDSSGVYYYLPDGLGSTVALTDGTGTVHTEYTYAPFGETTRTGTVGTNPFQFTGRENDNTGLYYYRARYYHPVLQRFISEDPIGFAGGDINLYGYVGNNPVNFTDPWGLDPGDLFASPGQAAADAINYINPTSIKENIEYCNWIYQKDGQYTYDEPIPGKATTCPLPPFPPTAAGWFHTHGDEVPGSIDFSEIFSGNDKKISDQCYLPAYLGTPSKSFKVYLPPGMLFPGMP